MNAGRLLHMPTLRRAVEEYQPQVADVIVSLQDGRDIGEELQQH